MMNGHNIDFLIVALVLLILVAYHFRRQKKLDSVRTRAFQIFLAAGLADVTLDIVTTLLLDWENGAAAGVTRFVLTIFYLMQALFPYFVVYYTQTLRRTKEAVIRRDTTLWGVVPALMCILIFINYWGEFLFGFDSAGRYYKGPLYHLMYAYAFLYTVAVVFICAIHFKELERQNIRVIAEFILIECVCVGIQAVNGTYLTTGLGIGLSMMILYITIHNPNTYIDNITGTFDKQFFMIWMREQFSAGKQIHAIMINILNLPQINKVFGSTLCDQALHETAGKLQMIGPGIRVFRTSGKRFLLAMETFAEYEKCRSSVETIFSGGTDAEERQIGFLVLSCGMVNCEKIRDVDTLLAYLEYMSALAPRAERITMIQSDSRIMEGFLREREIERFLETAIEEDLFEVYYQPVYSVKTGKFITLEALSRLRHPTLGYVPPDVFITLAEKNGRITQIGELQFRKICAFLKEHPQIMETIQNVKVNLSPLELLQHGHGRRLVGTIREYGLPSSWFQFEITETVATEYSENLLAAVDDFLQAGIGLCLDDFGSGYANINTVMNLPFSAVKLDRSLLSGILTDKRAATFYQSIAGVLKNLGYYIISEGVEEEEEFLLLKEWNVDMIQGYYFSRPLCASDLLALLLGKEKA